ncbi:hypothetical protein GCM10010232_42610 [Streptomyces amakusaensis]
MASDQVAGWFEPEQVEPSGPWWIVVGEPGGEPTMAPQAGQDPGHRPGSNRLPGFVQVHSIPGLSFVR